MARVHRVPSRSARPTSVRAPRAWVSEHLRRTAAPMRRLTVGCVRHSWLDLKSMSDERMMSARGKQWTVAGDIVIAMAIIGLIGAGNIGSQLARLAVARGYDVVLSNLR